MFSPMGLREYDDELLPEQMQLIHRYRDVMPDVAGDACGLWYENLVKLPKLEQLIKDPNTCI